MKCDYSGNIISQFFTWVNYSFFKKIILILKILKYIILSVLGK
jgi:hypothetical protein